MDFIEVEILAWAKHQPRKDIKHPTWFAMSNRILEDSKLFGLSGDEWHALLYLFCQASQQNSGSVKINVAHAERVCGIKKKTIISVLTRTRDAGVTSAYAIRTDAIRDTTLQDTTNTTEQDIARKPAAYAPAPQASRTNDFIAAYCRRFKDRWGVNPAIKGKNAGIAKRLAEGWSAEKMEHYLDAFFSMPDAQLVKWKHPLTALEMKLNEVTVFADSGQFTTHRQAVQADDSAAISDQLTRIREGKL